jgi:glucose/arabinose dehydrogenase
MRRALRRLIALCLLSLLGVGVAAPQNAARAATPTGFTDSLVVGGLENPTAVAFVPDGRVLVTAQGGQLRVVQNGQLVAQPAIAFGGRVCTNSERGLLGVAVDPLFAQNSFIYLYYTFNKHNACPTGQPTNNNNPVNRVSRFVLGSNNRVDEASETILIDNILSPNGNHNGGDLQFGKDGYLYIGVGDGGCDYAGDSGCAGNNDAARDQFIVLGKVLRITRDGGIPADNPFQGPNSARCNVTGRTSSGNTCQETFAWGLRNPFRLIFDQNSPTTRFFINDVGQNAFEEINLGQAGADYGYPCREARRTNSTSGKCAPTPPNLVDPIHDYAHSTGCRSITGGAFVPRGVWPAAYDDAFLFGDFVCGRMFSFTPNGAQFIADRDPFADGLGGIVHMTFGPSSGGQALYYTTYKDSGELRRIAYTAGANRAPSANASADKLFGPAPLTVRFSATGSDPDGDSVSYSWAFGDGTSGEGQNVTHVYTRTGIFTATLTARDTNGASAPPVSLRIGVGVNPPTVTIVSPAPDRRFSVGEVLTLEVRASDPEDAQPPLINRQIILHHIVDEQGRHTHPFLLPYEQGVGNDKRPRGTDSVTFTAPLPEDLLAAEKGYLEIIVTAQDSQGLTTVVTQELQPRRVALTFGSEPSGRRLQVNDVAITASQTLVSWPGYPITLDAPNQLAASGDWQRFRLWRDAPEAPRTRQIVTPNANTSYTAVFDAVPAADVNRALVPFICRLQ